MLKYTKLKIFIILAGFMSLSVYGGGGNEDTSLPASVERSEDNLQ